MASPHDGVTLSELERQRLREIEEGLARVDSAFVARFNRDKGMRMVLVGVLLVPAGLAILLATFTATLAGGSAGALVMAGGAGLAARGGRMGGWAGWWGRVSSWRPGRRR